MDVDATHLRYFQAVARAGSLTAAARALRVSQPTLTVAMRRLEEQLGTTLLSRERSGVRLTSTGQELLHYAGEVLALLERAEQQIQGLEREEIGTFVVGAPETLAAYFLPRFLRDFLRAAPRIRLSLWNGPSRAVQQAVIAREVHFGIVVNPLPHPDLVLVELFGDATDLFVAGTSRPRTARDARRQLVAGPLVYVGHLPQTDELLARLAKQSLVAERRLQCGTLELVKSLTIAEVGVGILPRRVAAYGGPGRLVRLHPGLPFVPDSIHLAYRADFHRTRAAVRLKEALTAHGRSFAG
jgi:molybdate transport repressor ModE-like protein